MKVHVPVSRLHELFVLHSDGAVTRKAASGKYQAGAKVGNRHCRGYLSVNIGKDGYLLHRVVWAMATGAWPTGPLDHINGDRTDNRLQNLREASLALNAQNIRKAKGDKKLPLGVSRARRGRYRARIVVERREISLGEFGTPAEAHSAYLAAKRRLHPGCTI